MALIIYLFSVNTKTATIEQRNYFKKGDIVEIFGPNHNIIIHKLDKIFDEEGNEIDVVRHPKQIVKIKINDTINIDDMIRVKYN